VRTIATVVFVLSAAAGGLFAFTAMLPYIAVLALSVVGGFIVQGNFSNLTSGVLAVPRGNDRTLFLHRLWRGIPRNTAVRRHARPIRRDVAACRLDCELRHLRARLFDWGCRINFPAPRHLATATLKARRPDRYRLAATARRSRRHASGHLIVHAADEFRFPRNRAPFRRARLAVFSGNTRLPDASNNRVWGGI
jgi:hypothetical protein